MSAWIAVLPKSRSRIGRIPTCASQWVPGRDLRHLEPRPRPDVGHSRRCAWPPSPRSAVDSPTVLLACRSDPAEKPADQAGFQEVRVEQHSRAGGFDSFDEYWEPIQAGTGSIPQIYLTLS